MSNHNANSWKSVMLRHECILMLLLVLESIQEAMRDHQIRFLKHTPLRFIQWVNFHHDRIEFTTLSK